MKIESVILAVFLFMFLLSLFVNFIDFNRRNKTKKHPFLSVIIPTYNDAKTITKTIKSVNDVYDSNNFEMIIINDKSTDDTLSVLKKLSKKYKFKLINNKENLGKVESLNRAVPLAKGELILFLDSDIILNKKALSNMIYLVSKNDVAASTSRYKPKNRGFLARMQELEYGMGSFIHRTYNVCSTLSLWGGCILIKKKAFLEVGMYSKNMIIEDVELALKLNEKKWKVKESYYFVETYVPETFSSFIKQKVRWTTGFGQTLFHHYKTYAKNPVLLLLGTSYLLIGLLFSFVFFKNILLIDNFFMIIKEMYQQGNTLFNSTDLYLGLLASFRIFRTLIIIFLYPLFSIPYALMNISSKKELYKLVYIFPFSIIYVPFYSVMGLFGIFRGFVVATKLRAGERGW